MARPTATGVCDRGHDGVSFRLAFDGGGGAYLCKSHWQEEMARRRERNLALSEANRFPVLPWPGRAGNGEG